MTEEMPKYETRRGGKRPGAGRKCKPGESYLTETFRADNRTLEILSEVPNKSAYIRKAISFYDKEGWRENLPEDEGWPTDEGWQVTLTEDERTELRVSIRAATENMQADANLMERTYKERGWEECLREYERDKERLNRLERIMRKL